MPLHRMCVSRGHWTTWSSVVRRIWWLGGGIGLVSHFPVAPCRALEGLWNPWEAALVRDREAKWAGLSPPQNFSTFGIWSQTD